MKFKQWVFREGRPSEGRILEREDGLQVYVQKEQYKKKDTGRNITRWKAWVNHDGGWNEAEEAKRKESKSYRGIPKMRVELGEFVTRSEALKFINMMQLIWEVEQEVSERDQSAPIPEDAPRTIWMRGG